MDKNLDDQFLIMQASVVINKQVTDEPKQDNEKFKNKLNTHEYDLDEIKTLLK